jgi:uncharacterized protein YcfJ
MITKNQIKMAAVVGVIGVAAAVVLPLLSAHHEAHAAEESSKSPVTAPAPVVAPAPTPAAPVAVVAPAPAPHIIYRDRPTPKPKPVVAEVKPEIYEIQHHQVCAPVIKTVEIDVPDPVQPQQHSAVGMLAGGAGGAWLGSQVGGGNGRTAMTILGALGGAMAGDSMAAPEQKPTTHKEQRNQTVQECHDETARVRVQ